MQFPGSQREAKRKPLSQTHNLDTWHGSVGVHGLPEGKGKLSSLLLASAEVSGARALLMGLEVPAHNRQQQLCHPAPRRNMLQGQRAGYV